MNSIEELCTVGCNGVALGVNRRRANVDGKKISWFKKGCVRWDEGFCLGWEEYKNGIKRRYESLKTIVRRISFLEKQR